MRLCVLHEDGTDSEEVDTRQEGDGKIYCVPSDCRVLVYHEVDIFQEEERD